MRCGHCDLYCGMCSRRVWSYSINGCASAIAYKSNINMNTVVCGALKSIGLSARRVLAKFHYTDTDTDFFCGETPLGPCGSVSPQKSPCPCPCPCRARVRVRVVEFSSTRQRARTFSVSGPCRARVRVRVVEFSFFAVAYFRAHFDRPRAAVTGRPRKASFTAYHGLNRTAVRDATNSS